MIAVTIPTKAQFDRLQARWRKAADRLAEAKQAAESRYGRLLSAPTNAAKRAVLSRLADAEGVAMEAVFAWLDAHSPRGWRSGVPAYWTCDALTYADATTAGQLSVTPPPSYGSTPADAERFARPL